MCFFSICLRKNDTKWKQLFKKISMIPYFVKSSLVKKQTIFSKIMSERTIFLWNIEWKIIFCKIIVTNSDNDSDKPTSGATNSAVPTIACTLDKRKLYKIKFFFVNLSFTKYKIIVVFYLFSFSKLHRCSKVNDLDSLSTSFSQDNVFWLQTIIPLNLEFQNISAADNT